MKSIVCLLILTTSLAHAVQIKTVRNFEDISVKASINEPNTVALTGDRIRQIRASANTLIDTCNGKPDCKMIDEYTGVLTFMPSSFYQTQSFTINLYTENGNFYNLIINPKPISSQTIVLNPEIKKAALSPKISEYQSMLVQLIQSLKNEKIPDGFSEIKILKNRTHTTRNTVLRQIKTISGNHFKGEIYELKNTGKQTLQIAESWFNWKGTRAIAVEKQQLAPGTTTRIYRIG